VQALDPANSMISRDGSRYSSSLRMTAEKTANYQSGDVPRGTLAQVWYPSPSLKITRRMYVYTPAGYESSGSTRYPVFYLLHGGGGDEDAWTTLGRAPEILDNLIASGKAKPMIVVMTNGNANQKASQDFLPAVQVGQQQDRLGFPKSLPLDVIPFVDKNYRTLTDKDNRAIAGLSMGGGQTFYAAFNNIDKFGWVGVFSAGWPTLPDISVPIPRPANADQLRGPDIERTVDPAKFLALMPQLDAAVNQKLKLLYIHLGAEDGLISAHQTIKDLLNSKGIKATYIETHGYGHEWAFWRVALQDFAPRLFQAAK
jgi:enterochelin esterase-like enzyme